jgi:hypothetical protein
MRGMSVEGVGRLKLRGYLDYNVSTILAFLSWQEPKGNHMRLILRLLALVFLIVVSCGASELSRDKAKEILDKVGKEPNTLHITFGAERGEQLRKMIGHGDIESVRPCVPDPNDVRIATGQFVACYPPIPSEVSEDQPGVLVTLTKTITCTVVEITGIAEGASASEKHVEFNWEYNFSSLSKEAQAAFRQGSHPGKALFRLYDDGWRYVKNE